MGRVEGKVAIVTGAGSIGPGWGNGKASAALMAREGARVVCADINLEAAEETRKIIEDEGGEAIAVHCDVSSKDEVAAMAEAAVTAFGGIDILHNNVGIAVVGGIEGTELDTWERVANINLTSAFLCTKAAVPHMLKRGGGAIVHTSSIAGIRHTGVDYVTYSTTKGALIPFSRSVALEYASRNIRSNCVLPGLMKTPMIEVGLPDAYSKGDIEEMFRLRDAQCPMGHMGDAWDVARAVLFLASDEARYITGTELVVDGGITAKFG